MSLPSRHIKNNSCSVKELSKLELDEKTEMKPFKKYGRAKYVADIFDIGKSTVWLYAKQGRFKSHKISDKVTLFNIDEVEKALFGDCHE